MRTLTDREARELLIRYHNLDGRDRLSGIEGVRTVMERLGSVQFDPLNVAGRNADLVMQSRVRNYRPDHLRDLLYREHFLVDGYDKEMCIYTARDFGSFAPQRAMHARDARAWLTNRGQGEGFDMIDDILAAIGERGPCALTDIAIGESRDFGWGPRRPSGAAIEYLFRAGRLCVADKAGTQRRFDLTERVLAPECLEAPERDEQAFADWYTLRRVRCVGLLWARMGGAWQGYVVSGNAARKAALQRLCDAGQLIPCRVEGLRETFYAVPSLLEPAARADGTRQARFIAPLDNLLWDRGMVEALFDFRYRWEVYTPVQKREYGYYVLPVLYGNRFIARFEPQNVSKAGQLVVKSWWWEADAHPGRAMLEAVEAALERLARCLGVPNCPENMDTIRNAARA